MAREPIAPYRRHLIETGVITEGEAAALEESVTREVEEAIVFARQSPLPAPETALVDMWAE